MDEWYRTVAAQLVARTRAHRPSEGDSALEVAFGRVRALVAYVLEFGRAHRVSIAGSVAGDDVWLQLGTGPRARWTLNRRDGRIVLRVPGEEGHAVRWDDGRRAMVDVAGAVVDIVPVARKVLEELVARWATDPSFDEPAAQPAREYEDEPTKG
jgi:hypothetical protein